MDVKEIVVEELNGNCNNKLDTTEDFLRAQSASDFFTEVFLLHFTIGFTVDLYLSNLII